MKKNMCAVERPYSGKRNSFSHLSNSTAFIYQENAHYKRLLEFERCQKVLINYLFNYYKLFFARKSKCYTGKNNYMLNKFSKNKQKIIIVS